MTKHIVIANTSRNERLKLSDWLSLAQELGAPVSSWEPYAWLDMKTWQEDGKQCMSYWTDDVPEIICYREEEKEMATYVIVSKPRKQEPSFGDWLDIISAFKAPVPPVIPNGGIDAHVEKQGDRWFLSYEREGIGSMGTFYFWEDNMKDESTWEELCQGMRRMYPNGHEDFVPLCLEMMETHSAKNYDYAHGGDALGNFDRVAKMLSMYAPDMSDPTWVGIVYMLKQLDAIMWMKSQGYEGGVEGIDSRWMDVNVYSILCRIMEQRNGRAGA